MSQEIAKYILWILLCIPLLVFFFVLSIDLLKDRANINRVRHEQIKAMKEEKRREAEEERRRELFEQGNMSYYDYRRGGYSDERYGKYR